MVINLLIGSGIIFAYLIKGYVYVAWVNYRCGADYNVHQFARGIVHDDALAFFAVILWPVIMAIHLGCNLFSFIENTVGIFSFLYSKLSFQAMYERGQEANNADLQIEKHLLTEKKPWYKFGR